MRGGGPGGERDTREGGGGVVEGDCAEGAGCFCDALVGRHWQRFLG